MCLWFGLLVVLGRWPFGSLALRFLGSLVVWLFVVSLLCGCVSCLAVLAVLLIGWLCACVRLYACAFGCLHAFVCLCACVFVCLIVCVID